MNKTHLPLLRLMMAAAGPPFGPPFPVMRLCSGEEKQTCVEMNEPGPDVATSWFPPRNPLRTAVEDGGRRVVGGGQKCA